MGTLLLQCVAPLQAWGTQSNFTVRDTGREPSKSGIIGLLCAALGRDRAEPIDDLAALRMGVRVDQEGTLLRDYHTAGLGGFLAADGKTIKGQTPDRPNKRPEFIPSNRYYIADAAFLVGLESQDADILQLLQRALSNPHWMLFLGRKACPPSRPVYLKDGLHDNAALETVLESYPWLGSNRHQHRELKRLRLVIEHADGTELKNDQPFSFRRGQRHFGARRTVSHLSEGIPQFRPQFMLEEDAA